MTMVPAENLSKQQHLHQEECFGLLMSRIELQGHEFYCTSSNCLLGSDNLGAMAEDESRSNSLSEAGSSSKAECERSDVEGSWLQLGIGNSKNINPPIATADEQRRLVELDLLPAATQLAIRSSSAAPMFHVPADQIPILTPIPHPHPLPPPARPFPNFTPSSLYFPSASPPHHHRHHQEVNWAFNIGTASTSSSSSSLMPQIGGSSYFARQFHQLQSPMDVSAVGPPSLDFRVVNPPRRPHSGIWFMLQASQNQLKQPFLPQIPKNYLRIKDGGMTVRLLIKYLVNKLRLDSESEIEITCRGQQLLPFLTLQHVRDNIWSPRDAVSLLPDSSTSTSDHVMVLQYARTSA